LWDKLLDVFLKANKGICGQLTKFTMNFLVFSSNVEDDDELRGSRLIIIFWVFSHVQKMITNLLARRRLLIFSSSAKDNNKPRFRFVVVFVVF